MKETVGDVCVFFFFNESFQFSFAAGNQQVNRCVVGVLPSDAAQKPRPRRSISALRGHGLLLLSGMGSEGSSSSSSGSGSTLGQSDPHKQEVLDFILLGKTSSVGNKPKTFLLAYGK